MKIDDRDREILSCFTGELAAVSKALAHLPKSSAHRRVKRLLGRGLLEKDGDRYRTSDRGLEAMRVTSEPASDPMDAVSPLLRRAPTGVHRAFLELLLAAWVVRGRDTSSDELHFSFWMFGPSMRWKTWLARLFALMVGLDPEQVVPLITAESGRSLFTRKGTKGVTVSRRRLLDRSFVCFDEFQNATADVRRTCGIYVQGKKRIAYENETLVIEPVPMFTMNPRPGRTLAERLGLSDQQVRRSILCDLSMIEIPVEMRTAGDDVLAEAARLGPIESPDPRREPRWFIRRIARELERYLVPRAVPHVDITRLAVLASGMSAFVEPDLALSRVLHDYLTVVDTVGWAKPNWASSLPRTPPGQGVHHDDVDPENQRIIRFLDEAPRHRTDELDYALHLGNFESSLRAAGVRRERYPTCARLARSLDRGELGDLVEATGRDGSLRATAEKLRQEREQLVRDQECWLRRRRIVKQALQQCGPTEVRIREAVKLARMLEAEGVSPDRFRNFIGLHRDLEEKGLGGAVRKILEFESASAAASQSCSKLRRIENAIAAGTHDLEGVIGQVHLADKKLNEARKKEELLVHAWSQLFRGEIPDGDVFWLHLMALAAPVVRTALPKEAAKSRDRVRNAVLSLCVREAAGDLVPRSDHEAAIAVWVERVDQLEKEIRG